jgi:hypothetical protein
MQKFRLILALDELEENVIPGSKSVVRKQLVKFTIEAALPVTERNDAPLDARRIPLMLHVPAVVIVRVPLMVGVFNVPPCHAVILTPAVRVTFSVTESLRKIVSPETASAIADAKVECVPFWIPLPPLATGIVTINFAVP